MEPINTRKKMLADWLATLLDCVLNTITPLPHDASFRRYYRIATTDTRTFIVMDAHHPQENAQPFAAIAMALRERGLMAPNVFAADFNRGFLLLTDFGDHTYLRTLTSDNVDSLYGAALKALAILQGCRTVPGLSIPPFTREFMQQEWLWHQEWFLEKLLNLSGIPSSLQDCYTLLVDSAANQPQVFMHRDYHSANLMVLPDNQVGLLDFQDAFIGPVTYDVVSLLRDCYIDWPPDCVQSWALQYLAQLQSLGLLTDISPAIFLQWFDWMGLQRHLKALLTYGRKYVRDQQSHYLQYVPRALKYILQVSARYPELAPLYIYYSQIVSPAFTSRRPLCVA